MYTHIYLEGTIPIPRMYGCSHSCPIALTVVRSSARKGCTRSVGNKRLAPIRRSKWTRTTTILITFVSAYSYRQRYHSPLTMAGNDNAVIGSSALRPVFLGNLKPEYSTAKVEELFNRPIIPPNCTETFKSIPVDRVDIKRGFCFVFLKDAASQEDKDRVEAFVSAIQGM